MSETKTKLCIAVPMYGGQVFGQFMTSMIQLVYSLNQNNIEFNLITVGNESLIPRARNLLATKFLNETDNTHLMFIDADIIFNPNDVLKMLEADKDVICGVYPKKEIAWDNVENAVKAGIKTENLKYMTGKSFAKLVNNNDFKSFNEPVQIIDGGTGFMLIKRETLEKIKPHVPNYWTAEETENYAFFDTSFEEKEKGKLEFLSEDYHFCRLVWNNDMSVWAAPWCVLDHIGTYYFSGAFGRTPMGS
jgi:hypothetical protein